MNHRHLIIVKDIESEIWLQSRWFDYELYPLAPLIYGINEYSSHRLDPMLNEGGMRFIIITYECEQTFRFMFCDNVDAIQRFAEFLYLTRPLPSEQLLLEERQAVVNQLLDKILYFETKADALTYDESHFFRTLNY